MSEKTREAISALMDGEADELEVHRTLNQLKDSPELREQWQRYHLMGAVLKEEAGAINLNLADAVAAAIDEDNSDIRSPVEHSSAPVVVRSPWYSRFAGGAVAASVALAVVLGFQQFNSGSGELPTQLVQNTSPSVQAMPVAVTPAVSPVQNTQQLAATQEKLQQYLLEHAEHAALNTSRGMMPFARVASFEQDSPMKEGARK